MKTREVLFLVLIVLSQISAAQASFSMKVDHYAILVDDLGKSATFYGQILGLTEVENQTKDPNIRWFALADGREIHLINRSKEGIKLNKNVHLAFAVNDLDGFMQFLDGKKVPYENWKGTPFTTNSRPDRIRQIYVKDPDGYWIEINDVKR